MVEQQRRGKKLHSEGNLAVPGHVQVKRPAE
jgi:hypothetical protein